MLRDTLGRRTSDNTEPFLANVPGTDTDGTITEESHTNDLNDDIFGSAPSSPTLDTRNGGGGGNEHSDIPRLRSLHITNGYREGIALSKEEHIQAGFDEGFSLGGEIGQRVGYLLGVLEGVAKGSKEDVDGVYKEAQEELTIEKLLGEEWFGTDGVWLYEVPGEEGDADVGFEEVANAHPVVQRWEAKVKELTQKVGLMLVGDEEEG